MQYELKIIYKDSQPSEIWGPYSSREAAVDVMQKAESYPRVVDIILIPVVD